MIKLFKTLKGSRLAVFLIIVLLFAQAWCELALPSYTSDIINIGIQSNGIEHIAMDEIRATTYEDLQLFMTSDERAQVDAVYTRSGDVYKRGKLSVTELEPLDTVFGIPMLYYSFVSGGLPSEMADMTLSNAGGMQSMPSLEQLRGAAAAGMLSDEAILQSRSSITSLLDEMGMTDTLINQMAVRVVADEYEALGVDLGKVQQNYLWLQGAKMIGMTLAAVTAAICVGFLAARVGAKIGFELRGKVFGRVVSFSNAEIDKFSSASLITRSTNDIQQVQNVVVLLLRMVIYSPILGIGGVLKVLAADTGMGWIIFVALAFIMVLLAVMMALVMPRFKKMQTLIDRLNMVAREILTGLPVIRAFSRERHEENRFKAANSDLTKTQLFTSRIMMMSMPIMTLIMNALSLIIVWFGAKGIDAGVMQVGDMMAFITYTMQIVMSFLMLSMVFIMVPRAVVSVNRIDEILQTEPVIHDPAENSDDLLKDSKGVVTFRDVSFRYPDAEANVLEHISFTAKPGETTAVIGSTGSGKSTVLNLIPRFYDVTEGAVLIDGVDIRDVSQATLRAQLGYVPQKGLLFSGDIESNIKFAGDHITDEEMKTAAMIAQASDFIEEKDEKYSSSIAQGGTNVSGGQKQRLSIARAIAKNPKIYLFDDSFSALDYKTDIALRRALAEYTANATVIIVAQRISTILHANQIVVLDEGRVVGIGTHEELLRDCETYREIAKSQLSENELGGVGA